MTALVTVDGVTFDRDEVHVLDALRLVRAKRSKDRLASAPIQAGAADDDAPVVITTSRGAYGSAKVTAACAELAKVAEGGRNNALNATAYALGRFVESLGLDLDDLRRRLEDACSAGGNGLTVDDGIAATRASVESGLRAGLASPRAVVESVPSDDDPFGTGLPDSAAATVTERQPRPRALDGAAFILGEPEVAEPVWGHGERVVWAKGEALMLVGPQGAGKTTLAQQLTLARLGLRGGRLLDLDVAPTARRVLYLACDRPRQAARSFRRMVTAGDEETLRDRLVVWKGPPPYDVAKRPQLLAEMAAEYDADTIVVDSLKDVAIGLTDDETGALYNQARQLALAAGIEIVEIHHQRKNGNGGGKPKSINDVYGSVWITSGAGSVLLVWGDPGDAVVEALHLKQPVEDVGPLKLLHDHRAGLTTLYDTVDPLDMLRRTGSVTARQLAATLYDVDAPKPGQVERARRKLDSLVAQGLASKDDVSLGGAGGSRAATYRPAVSFP